MKKLYENKENCIVIIRDTKKTKISLEERFKNYHGENQTKYFNWDDSKGKEIW